MKFDVEVTICFAPKPWIFKWQKLEAARQQFAIWLVRLGLRVSGSSEMIVTPHLWRPRESQENNS